MKLDKTDRRILDVLQRDGRISVTDLAERVGLSPTPCARRIRQLETSGLIQGYAAIVDPKRAGQAIQAIVQIKLAQHSDEIVERFRRTLLDRPEVLACYTMTGEMDFLLHVIVRDIEALSDFTMRRLLRVPGVRDVTSSIVLETVKRSAVIPLEELAPE
jgi:Lrp/AsnC family leucine-responsive transcriptional regulator